MPALLLSLALGLPSGALAYWSAAGRGDGSGLSGDVTPPTEVLASQQWAQGAAAVSWTASGSDDLTGYRVQRSADAGATWVAACGGSILPASTLACSEPGLIHGSSTLFRVTAIKGGWTATSAASTALVIDLRAPRVGIEQSAGQADPTRSLPISFTIAFDEPVLGFDANSIELRLGGSAIAGARQVARVDETTYMLTVSGISGDGEPLVATMPAGRVTDRVGNPSSASTSSDNSVVLDNVAPSRPGSTRLSPVPAVDTGVSQTDGITRADSLVFVPSGSVPSDAPIGSTVRLHRATSIDGPGSPVKTAGVAVTGHISSGGGYSLTYGSQTTPADAGTFWYYVTITDALGNTSEPGARQAVTVDRDAPSAPTVSSATQRLTGLLTSAVTTSGGYSNGTNDSGAITVYVCTGAVSSCTPGSAYANSTLSPISGGAYTAVTTVVGVLPGVLGQFPVTVTHTDVAGNVSAPSTPRPTTTAP